MQESVRYSEVFRVHFQDNLCNCDDHGVANIDNGVLQSMRNLPVTKLNYGDGNQTHSFIHYKLGDLTCSGKNYLYPSEISNTDFSFMATISQG